MCVSCQTQDVVAALLNATVLDDETTMNVWVRIRPSGDTMKCL